MLELVMQYCICNIHTAMQSYLEISANAHNINIVAVSDSNHTAACCHFDNVGGFFCTDIQENELLIRVGGHAMVYCNYNVN